LIGRELRWFGEAGAQLAALFLAHDATLFEVNPLMLTEDGPIVLDAHIVCDDDAINRHLDLASFVRDSDDGDEMTQLERAATEIDGVDHRGVAGRVVEFDGPLALLIGGGGASLCIFDAVLGSGLKPANYAEVGGNPTPEKVSRLTELLLRAPRVTGLAIVMNVVNNTRADLIAEGVISGVLAAGREPAATVLAFRVPGADEVRCKRILAEHNIRYLDAAVSFDDVAAILLAEVIEGDADANLNPT
jgi:succinyl-CoA synthetase beta subunit